MPPMPQRPAGMRRSSASVQHGRCTVVAAATVAVSSRAFGFGCPASPVRQHLRPVEYGGIFVGHPALQVHQPTQGVARQFTHLTNYADVALGFFNNLRITTVLLTGASLGGLFTGPPTTGHWPRACKVARCIYIAGMALTVAHCLMVAFICTIATTTVVLGHVDTMATSAEALLMGPIRLEYMTCRAFFLVSLVLFISSIAAKIFGQIVANDEASDGEKVIGSGIICFLLHTVFAQWAYINRHLQGDFGNLALLYMRVVGLWLTRFNPFQGIAAAMSLVFYLAFLGVTAAGLVRIVREYR